MTHLKTRQFLLAAFVLFFASLVQAEIPRYINYQGKLTDNAGQGLTGTYNFVFTLYDGAVSTWTETQNGVSVANGLYNVQLGSVNNTLANLPFSTTYYLQIKVGLPSESLETLSPMQPLAATPYAFRSKIADSINASGTRDGTKFLKDDYSWADLSGTGVGDMLIATHGFAIGQATGSLRTDLTNLQRSTFTPTSVGSYENLRVGTATIAYSLNSGLVASYQNIQVGTATVAANLRSSTVASYENIRVGTATVALSISPANIRAGTLSDTVRVSTESIIASGGAGASTFLCGDGSWSTPTGAGDMTRAVDGANILLATSSLRTSVTNLGISTGTIKNEVNALHIDTGTLRSEINQIHIDTGAIQPSKLVAGTLNDNVRVSTASVIASGSASAATFLCGNGSWATPPASGDMTRAVDGLNILTATSTLRTEVNQLHLSTGAIMPSNIIAGILPSNVSVSSFQTGGYENVRVGTATIAYSLNSALIASYQNIQVGTATVAANLRQATVASYENIRVGTATIAYSVPDNSVQVEAIRATGINNNRYLRGNGTWDAPTFTADPDTMYMSIHGANIIQSTTALTANLDSVQRSTFSVTAGTGGISVSGESTKTFSVIASSFQAGAYENIRVGTATLALGVSAGAVSDAGISASAAIAGSKLSDALVISSMTATGFVGLMPRTAAQLQGMTPTAVGQLYFCTSDNNVYVSTGTTEAGSFSKLSNPASGPW